MFFQLHWVRVDKLGRVWEIERRLKELSGPSRASALRELRSYSVCVMCESVDSESGMGAFLDEVRLKVLAQYDMRVPRFIPELISESSPLFDESKVLDSDPEDAREDVPQGETAGQPLTGSLQPLPGSLQPVPSPLKPGEVGDSPSYPDSTSSGDASSSDAASGGSFSGDAASGLG